MNWDTSMNHFKKSFSNTQILIKDHKKLTSMGEFPTRLVIPATNFSATFAKVGYLGMKNTLKNNEKNYTKFTIIQASQVKEEWEILNWKRIEVTISSIDAVAMYPSIKFPLVKKAISYFTRNLSKSQQSSVKLCLKLIAFGMSSTLLTFEEKYYEYGEKGIETKGIAISGYKSAFLADLVVSYLFEECKNQFKEVQLKGYTDTVDC